jgi:transcriptional regulator with XRE-family HTH domain
MKPKRPIILPKHRSQMAKVGEQFKLARLRRKLSMDLVAERANISRSTLWKIENGDPSVAMGSYYNVLMALSLEDDFMLLAADDQLGRTLQDLNLPLKQRAPK